VLGYIVKGLAGLVEIRADKAGLSVSHHGETPHMLEGSVIVARARHAAENSLQPISPCAVSIRLDSVSEKSLSIRAATSTILAIPRDGFAHNRESTENVMR
jgi:hypothetical protein